MRKLEGRRLGQHETIRRQTMFVPGNSLEGSFSLASEM